VQVTSGETMRSARKEELRAQIQTLVDAYAAIEFEERKFVPGETPVPPSGKLLGGQELRNMVDASLDAWLTTGRFNAEFERKLARFLGVRSLITVNSGSSANLVAFATLTSPKLGNRAIVPGDEVIAVAAGFPTTVNPILQYGAVPVFVDVDPETYNVNIEALRSAITPRTRAIMLAHTLGNPFDVASVLQIAKEHELWVIEDCCDALGSRFDGRLVGTFGHIGTLSFYPAHHITMGEGGAVFTNDPKLKRIAESFRDWGRDCFCDPGRDNTCGKRYEWKLGSLPEGYDHKYIYSHIGYNLKITDMQAACGVAQLARLEDFIAARKRNFSTLYELLAPFERDLRLPKATPGSDPSWFGFPITLRPECRISRLSLLKYLEGKRIGSRLLFAGNLTRQPSMQGQKYRVSGELRVTDEIMERTFWVGIHPALSRAALETTASAIQEALSSATN
jgi:CDP-6-deoxy-D-xylo-4-hexulose-3-dehydrase